MKWSIFFKKLENMKSCHKLSKNCSIHVKNRGIFGPYNLWTTIKNNKPDVWNWNYWTFFWFGSWSGEAMVPLLPPSGYVPVIGWKSKTQNIKSGKYQGYKGQNSTETQCHNFLVLNVDVVFQSWNLDVMVFSYLKNDLESQFYGLINWLSFSMEWTIERKKFLEVYPLFFKRTF